MRVDESLFLFDPIILLDFLQLRLDDCCAVFYLEQDVIERQILEKLLLFRFRLSRDFRDEGILLLQLRWFLRLQLEQGVTSGDCTSS